MKEDKVYIKHILECIDKINKYTRQGKKTFMLSELIQDAVIRNLEIIGEASKNISQELKGKNPNITWKEMAGLRDVLIHEYFGVDLYIVWNVVKNELPKIKTYLDEIKEQ